MAAYYAFAAKSLQRFIFASNRLAEIAGASELVERLGRDVPEELNHVLGTGGTILWAAAGGCRIRFPNLAAAERFAAHMPLAVHRHAPGITFTQAIAEPDATGSSVWRRLSETLAVARNDLVASLPEAGPLAMRSPRTGSAAVDKKTFRRETAAVDAASLAKINAYPDNGTELRLEERLSRLVEHLYCQPPQWCSELTDIAPHDGAYVALVHADGNALGQLNRAVDQATRLLELGRQAEIWEKFSNGVATATEQAFRRALADRAGTPLVPLKDGRLPVRPVVLGGDDLTVIMPAEYGLTFAAAFCRSFAEESATALADLRSMEPALAGLPDRLTATAGVVMAKDKYPFMLAYGLCESLCRHAKRAGAAQGGTPPAMIAFHRVTAGARDNFAEVIRGELTGSDDRALTLNPYALDSADTGGCPSWTDLLALTQALADLPRGPWRRLAATLHEGVPPDTAIQRMRVVAQDSKDGGEAWQRVEKAWASLMKGRDGSRSDGEPTASPLADALTLIAVKAGNERADA